MTALTLLLFQSPTPLQPAAPPEKLPAWLTLIYLSGIALVGLLLLVSIARAWFARHPTAHTAPANLPKDLRKRLGATSTNRGLRAWRWLFALAAIFIFGFHVYWARYASERNPKFQELSYKDLRNRRLSESTLRGWIYDRKGRPLAYYKKNNEGEIDREYPMDSALAHIFGTDRGEPGLERALFGAESCSRGLANYQRPDCRAEAEQGLQADYRSGFAAGRRRSVERQSRRGRDVQPADGRSAGDVQQSLVQPQTGRRRRDGVAQAQ